MIMPKPYELYSYFETKEVYAVVCTGYCKNIGYMVTLREVNSELADEIVVPVKDFNEELEDRYDQRYPYSRVILSPITHNPRQTLSVIPTCELVAELNSRGESFYGIDRSMIVDHYYDLGVNIHTFEDGDFPFIKRKEAQTKDQMLQTLQSMEIEAQNCGGKPIAVRHHIVIEVIDPESERPI